MDEVGDFEAGPLDVDMSASGGDAEAVALLLERTAEAMAMQEDAENRTFDVEIRIEEHD